MRHDRDKKGSKLPLLLIFVVFIYLAFFGFDVKKAYKYTVEQNADFIHSFVYKK